MHSTPWRAAALTLLTLLGPAAPALAQDAEPAPAAEAASETPAPTPAPSGEIIDGIAAQIGTEVVLVSEVDRVARPIEPKVREQGGTDQDIAMLRSDVLDKLIERKLIQIVAKRAEIEATEFEIDDAVNSIARENGMTVEEMQKSVTAQGLTWEAYRARLAEEVVQSKVLGGMVRPRAKVEEQQIRRLYDQRYGAMPAAGGQELHILHMAAGADDGRPESVAAACDRVQRGLSRVRGGEPFAKVASEVSMAAPDLGYLPEHALAPWMRETAAAMQPGQVSGVIRLPVGCAVLQLVDRRTIEALTYDQAKGQLRAILTEQAFQEEYVKFIDRLRKQTYVERRGVFADALDVASPPPMIR
jgi:peptidyl-prolyl cis-trans isomerase SurA